MAKKRHPTKGNKNQKPQSDVERSSAFGDRSGMRLLQRAVSEGWQIPEWCYRGAPAICTKVLVDEKMPIAYRLRASELLAAMQRDKIQAAIALDRMERLEANEATDRVVVTPDIDALAEQIIARRLGDDIQ
jgi:hypothetical protein